MVEREAVIEKKVCAFAKAKGWLVHPKVGPSARGWPDRTFSKKSRLIFVEFKSDGKKPRPLQRAVIANLKERGYEVHVITSVEAGRDLFASAEERSA